MIYNLSPITNLLTPDLPNRDVWRERIQSFFHSQEYDAELQDWYYDKLISNISEVDQLLRGINYVDPYTGLFSMPSPHIEATHSFNFAKFISDHYQHFYGKKILTVCADFGILNIQAKFSGLNLISSIQKEYYNIGTVLTCIGNNCPPYPINKFDFEEEDVIMMSCVFQEDDLTYKNWEFMLDKRLNGKEVFFTSNTYVYLRRYMNYDKIELVIDPKKMYNSEDYADISYGYMNKIYRLK
jgi:hypothetical protein